MKNYTVIFDYGPLGGEKKRYVTCVKAHNKAEAALRAGARFREDTGQGMPQVVEYISVTGRSLHGWSSWGYEAASLAAAWRNGTIDLEGLIQLAETGFFNEEEDDGSQATQSQPGH